MGKKGTEIKNANSDGIRIQYPENSDQSTCFHGHDIGNCNQQNFHWRKNCLWWYFFPSDREKNLNQKYLEILNSLNISKI